MLSKLKVFRYVGIFVVAIMLCGVLIYPVLKGKSASNDLDDTQKQTELSKAKPEKPDSLPASTKNYNRLANIVSDCGPLKQIIKDTGIDDPIAPTATLCINGSLAAADPQMFRSDTVSNNGTGLGACPGAVEAKYDVYSFNLTGCAAFPTLVRITLCGPAGCLPPQAFDTRIYIYRNVPAGDTLSANGGLPNVFNAASPCTNLRGANDTLSGGASNTAPNGNSCSQSALPPQTCEAPPGTPCATSISLSGFHRKLGNGRFTVVVTGTNTADLGNYNLFIDAASAGCAIALAPTAAGGVINGRVSRSDGSGISKAAVTVSGGSLSVPITVKTNPFGYYSIPELETGQTYIVTVASKTYTFTNSSQTVSLEDSAAEVNFVSEQ